MMTEEELIEIGKNENYLNSDNELFLNEVTREIEEKTYDAAVGGEITVYGRSDTIDFNTFTAINPPSHISYMEDGVYRGEYDKIPESTEVGSIIDIGAYVGGFSKYALLSNTQRPLLIIEPLESNISLIKKNLENHKDLSSTFLFKLSVGSSEKVAVKIGEDDDISQYLGTTYHSIDGKSIDENNIPSNYELVQSISLKELLLLNEICTGDESIFLMKIDCEGEEYPFFENASTEDIRKIKHIVGEFHKDSSPDELFIQHGFEQRRKNLGTQFYYERID